MESEIDRKERERQGVILAARRMIDRQPIYLDTETTGLGPEAEIVEIAIINDQGETLLDTLVRPGNPIPPEAEAIHGISNAMVADAPRFDAVWHGQLQRVLAGGRLQLGQQVCIYNAAYDLRLITQSLAPYNINTNGFFKTPMCIMELYAQFWGEWSDYHHSYRWQSLERAALQCGLAVPPDQHRALADCLTARAVLHYMAAQQVVADV